MLGNFGHLESTKMQIHGSEEELMTEAVNGLMKSLSTSLHKASFSPLTL